jgi:hypothetical protein
MDKILMTKEQTFRAILESEVKKALKEVYEFDGELTEKQALLTDRLSQAIYAIIGKNMTVEEFKKKYAENVSSSLQKD